MLEGEGTIRTLNNKAQAMLGLPPDAVHNNIQDIIFSSDIIRAILSESGQFSDRGVPPAFWAARSTVCFRSPAWNRGKGGC